MISEVISVGKGVAFLVVSEVRPAGFGISRPGSARLGAIANGVTLRHR